MAAHTNSILIVDDDQEMRDLLKDILEDHGYPVAVVREGREALDHLERDEYLVVLTDLRMKGMDGTELLHELVQRHPACNTIMMTAFGTVESAVDAMKRGAFAYLTKPITTDELLVTADKRGLFEEAQGGTLFLDEISEMPMLLQAKLLRAVQEREIRRVGATQSIPVNVRIFAATNLTLAEEVTAKRFREDLYYRLNVIEIRLPPLRDRKEDIPLLCNVLLHKMANAMGKLAMGIAESALGLLIDYHWPGNVRELENVIERAVTLAPGDIVTVEALPATIREANGERRLIEEGSERSLPMEEIERVYIKRILEKTQGNKLQAAQILGIDRKTLYRKLGDMKRSAS